MVKQRIVLGHVILEKGIEVDKAKVDLISNLPPLKQIRSFLGHDGFYRRFIKDFSKLLDHCAICLPRMFRLSLVNIALKLSSN